VTHLDSDDILRGFDGARDEAHREEMYRHVAECTECRELMAAAVADTTSAADDTPPPSTDRWPIVPYEHYDIGDEVGRGGLGKVVRARHVALDRTVAIKELLRAGKTLERRFLREAHVTASLQHPGVVPVLEAGRWPSGEPFYATKLVSGRTLQELMAAATTAAAGGRRGGRRRRRRPTGSRSCRISSPSARRSRTRTAATSSIAT
jgi:hypothetical protein